MLPLDTTPGQQKVQDELVRRLGEHGRAAALDDLCDGVRQLAAAGIRHRNPGASPQLVRWLLAAQIYGAATANAVCGPRPER